ncbi:MAG: Sec-independent protein translocase subunit TatB [Rhodoferax sp.]|nr:Sec-independent protein translocase subunit TatB [Rhodoferax sp.]
MFDIGVTKLAIIGAIALVVIGPERLPGVARTMGTLLGRARRYVADVQAEVSRSMELDELKKMKDAVVDASRDVEHSLRTSAKDLEHSLLGEPDAAWERVPDGYPQYRHPRKHWRLKRSVMPGWYKAHSRVRTKALSGAARVARFRPPKLSR